MNFILDTNILIWLLLQETDKITAKAKKEISSSQNICYISTISLWEIAIKKHVKKLTINYSNSEILDLIKDSGFYIMAIPPVLVNHYEKLPMFHKDPFDRMIIAHAIKNKYAIITSDKHFKQYGVKVVW